MGSFFSYHMIRLGWVCLGKMFVVDAVLSLSFVERSLYIHTYITHGDTNAKSREPMPYVPLPAVMVCFCLELLG